MSDKSKDVQAAEKEFLEIFRVEDLKSSAKLTLRFLSGFLRGYHSCKKELSKYKSEEDNLRDKINLTARTGDYIARASYMLESARLASKEEDKVYALGESLGDFLAAVDYGITDPRFDYGGNASEQILVSSRSIAQELKEMGKKIRSDFIGNRIQQIAKAHTGKLSQKQQELLARIAVTFRTA